MYSNYEIIGPGDNLPVELRLLSLGQSYQYRWHDGMEIVWVLYGSVTMDFYTEKHELVEGDLFVINESSLHNIIANGDNLLLLLKVDMSYYKNFYPSLDSVHFFLKDVGIDKSILSQIKYSLSKIAYGYEMNKDTYKNYIFTDIRYLLSYLMENCSTKGKRSFSESDDADRVKRILSYVEDNYREKISLKELSEKEGLSLAYMSRFIKDKLGLSFQNYLNEYRLDRFLDLLLRTDESISDLSDQVGFASSNYMNKVFKEKHGLTPSEYRNRSLEQSSLDNGFTKVQKEYVFRKLRYWVNLENRNFEDKTEFSMMDSQDLIEVSLEGNYYSLNKYWQNVLNIERSNVILSRDMQSQLKTIQREIGFKYARINMVFTDSSSLKSGLENYNRDDMFEIIDFLLSIGLKPFIELSHEDRIPGTNPMPFTGIDLEFLDLFIRTIVNRYGIFEVKQWRFECWNRAYSEDPTYKDNVSNLHNEYGLIWDVIKSISKDIPLGVPVISNNGYLNFDAIEEFIEYVEDSGCDFDFLTIHLFNKKLDSKLGEFREFNLNEYRLDINPILKGEYRRLSKLLREKLDYDIEIYMTEWTMMNYEERVINDSSIAGAFVLDSIVSNIFLDGEGASFLIASDLLQIEMDSAHPFIGGRGLMTKNGIRKFSYNVYYLLAKLGEDLVDIGRNYIVTKTRDSVQILIYNYRDLDKICLEVLKDNNPSRIDVCYEMVDSDYIRFSMKGISGKYEVTEYSLSREDGSAYYNWLKMGSPKALKSEEIRYLSGRSLPSMEIKEVKVKEGDCFRDSYLIPAYGLKFITMDKIF